MADDVRLSKEGQGAHTGRPGAAPGPGATPGPGDGLGPGSGADPGPGAIRVRPGTIVLNADREASERLRLVIVNTGDRPVQIGSHLHLPDANTALAFDREAAAGFRLDIPSGTSQRFEPGASREVDLVALRGNRLVPGIQLKHDSPSEVDRG